MILTIRTDNPKAEIGLYQGDLEIACKTWQAHRELSATIHRVISELLTSRQKNLRDITGIVFYAGPGSFTGLRIGAAVANALSENGIIPLVQANGETWVKDGLQLLKAGESGAAMPVYGSEALTTKPKK